MKYKYRAYHEDENKPFYEEAKYDGKPTKNTVTINITVEIEKEKYEEEALKSGKSISEKIYKLFQ